MLKFSIATPTFNSLEKLKRCVGSVRGQKKSALRVEHIIQDAKSPDGTADWLKGEKDILWESEVDDGMYDAINRAWERATGDVFSWLNSDEQYLPGTLDKVQNYFNAHPDVDVVFGNYIVCDNSGGVIALRREIDYCRKYVLNGFLNMQSATIFFRRRLYDHGLLRFDTTLRYAADKDLILRLDSNNIKFGRINDYLSIFGVDGENLSTHPGVQSESILLKRRYGASDNRIVIIFYRLCRLSERFFSGGLFKRDFSFMYAIDAIPNYLKISAHKIGGSYSLTSKANASQFSIEDTPHESRGKEV